MWSILLAALVALAFLTVLSVIGRLDFLAREIPDLRRRMVAAASLLAILAAAVFYPGIAADDGGAFDPTDLWFPGLFLGHAMLVVFLLVWWRLQGDISLPRFLHSDRMETEDIRLGVQLGAVGWTLTILVTGLVAWMLSPFDLLPKDPEVPPVMLWFAAQPLGRKLIIIAVAMTVEEAFFRGFLQPRLGLFLSSLLFALGHASYGLPLMIVSVFVISLVIGWGLLRTGRLLPCIVAHGVFDAIQLIVVLPWAAKQISGLV